MPGVWTEIETDFPDDETCNFGKRVEISTENCLYSLQTLSTLNPNGEIHQSPHFFGSSDRKFASIVVDSIVHVFTIDPFESVFSGDFEKSIKWVKILDELDVFLVVTSVSEKNSKLQIFSIRERKVVHARELTGVQIDGEVSPFINATIEKGILTVVFYSDDSKSLFFIRFDGWKNVKTSTASTLFLGEVVSFCGFLDENKVFLLGDNFFAIFSFNGENFFYFGSVFGSFDDLAISSEVIVRSTFVLVVQKNGTVSIFDSKTLTLFTDWKFGSNVENFAILDDLDDEKISFENLKIAAVCRSDDRFFVEVRSLRDFSLLYSFSSSDRLTLINGNKRNGFCFVLESARTNFDSQFPDQIRIRLIAETNPTLKLNRLIAKGNFREAERFANLHGFDSQSIFVAEGKFLLSNGASLSSVIECLKKIDDDAVVAVMCRDSIHSHPFDERLNYALKRLKIKFSVDATTKTKLFEDISGILYRWATFEMIFPDDESCRAGWSIHHKEKIAEFFLLLIKNGNFSSGGLVLTRHETDIMAEMNENFLQNIFSSIMEARTSSPTELGIIAEFLTFRFLPAVLRFNPYLVDLTAKFLHDFALSLESVGRNMTMNGGGDRSLNFSTTTLNGFPKNALEFAEILVNVKNNFVDAMQFSTAGDVARLTFCLSVMNVDDDNENSPTGRLNRTIKFLKELDRLFTVYNLKMSFDEFAAATKTSVCFRLLDKIGAVELFEDAVKTYVAPYCDEKRLELDSVLVDYVDGFLRRKMSNSTIADDFKYSERKILIIFRFLKNVTSKCRCALKLFEFSSFPLSADVESALKEVETFKNPLVGTIKEKRRLMNMKLILIKYDLPSDALSTPRAAVLNIVRHNSSSSVIDDALLIAENFKCMSKLDCFYFRLIHFLTDSQIDEAIDFLKNLSKSDRKICLTRLIGRLYDDACLLQDFDIDLENYERLICQLDVVSPFVAEVVEAEDYKIYCNLKIKLKSVRMLMKSFDLSVNFCQMYDENFATEFLNREIDRFVTDTNKKIKNLNCLLIVADLFNVDRENFTVDLLEKLISKLAPLEKIMSLIQYLSGKNFKVNQTESLCNSFSTFLNSLMADSEIFLSSNWIKSIEIFVGNLLMTCNVDQLFSLTNAYKMFSRRLTDGILPHADDASLVGMKGNEKISISFDRTIDDVLNENGKVSENFDKWTKYVEIFLERIVLNGGSDVCRGFSFLLTLPADAALEMFHHLSKICRKRRRILFTLAGAISLYRDDDRSASLNFFRNSFYLDTVRKNAGDDDLKTKQFIDAVGDSTTVDVQFYETDEKMLFLFDTLFDSGQSVDRCRIVFDLLYDNQEFDDILLKSVENRLLNVRNFDPKRFELVSIRRLVDNVREPNRIRLCRMFKNVLNKANPYLYEILSCTLNFLCQYDERAEILFPWNHFLTTLRCYERRSTIDADEHQVFAERCKQFGQSEILLENVLCCRLPFHYFFASSDEEIAKFWSTIMKNEIYFDNLNFWLEILANFFVAGPISRLDLINFATKNALKESNFGEETLENLKKYLSNENDFVGAISLMASVAKLLTSNEMKIEAYEFCANLLYRRMEAIRKCDRKESSELKKLELSCSGFLLKSRKIKTEKCLLEADLLSDAVKSLLDQPARLIIFILNNDHEKFSREKISSTLNEIAEINLVDLKKIYESQLNYYFIKSFNLNQDDDVTNLSVYPTKNASLCCDFLDLSMKRLEKISLLFTGKTEEEIIFWLLNLTKNDDPKITSQSKIFAIRTLFSMFSPKRFKELTMVEPEKLRGLLTDLIYVTWFENLNLPQTVKNFQSVDKLALVVSFCDSLKKKKCIFNIAVSLLVDNSIRNKKIIEILMKFSADSALSKDLSIILLNFIHSNINVWRIDDLSQLWKRICDRFNSENGSLSTFLKHVAIHTREKCPDFL